MWSWAANNNMEKLFQSRGRTCFYIRAIKFLITVLDRFSNVELPEIRCIICDTNLYVHV